MPRPDIAVLDGLNPTDVVGTVQALPVVALLNDPSFQSGVIGFGVGLAVAGRAGVGLPVIGLALWLRPDIRRAIMPTRRVIDVTDGQRGE